MSRFEVWNFPSRRRGFSWRPAAIRHQTLRSAVLVTNHDRRAAAHVQFFVDGLQITGHRSPSLPSNERVHGGKTFWRLLSHHPFLSVSKSLGVIKLER